MNIKTLIPLLIITALLAYGAARAAKTFSYSYFYEDMVTKTIEEKVKRECLL